MYLFKIAFRNIFRRRGRTFIIAGLLTLAVVLFLFLESLMMGLMDTTFSNITDFEISHIEVGREAFFTEEDRGRVLPLDQGFTAKESMEQEIEGLEGFQGLTGVLDFSADFIAKRHEFPVRVRAIDTESFADVFRNHNYILEGDFLQPGGSGVVIGNELARFFGLEQGDSFTLRFQDTGGSFNTIQGEVQGIVSVPHPEMNLGTVFVHQEQAWRALDLEEATINRLMVRLSSRGLAPEQSQVLRDRMEMPLEVRSYRDGAEFLVALEAWGMLETYFILGLLLLVGAIGIISTVILSAIERVREIGMMKAMGLREREIVQVFLWEAGGIGVLGGLMGCAISVPILYWLVETGISFEIFFDLGAMGVPLGHTLTGVWNPSSFFLMVLFVMVVSILASIIPAFWAARKDPVAAIRYR